MIPDIAKKGASFKGALAYYLHDKRHEGEQERHTSERVAWTETRNLMTKDPEMAGKVMAATALDAERLKQQAGVRNTGRKSDNSVYAYTLSWHPDEAKTLQRSDMVSAADETLKALGAQDRQALIVCHTDRAHPHVHVILNRVSPEDGRMLKTGNDRLKLSQWALQYREARGEQHYCPQRAENWDKRLSRHDGNEKLKYWRAAADTPRSLIEDVRRAKAIGDPNAAKLEARFKKEIGQLSAKGVAMKDRHRTEWHGTGETRPDGTKEPKGIVTAYRERKAEIEAKTIRNIAVARDGINKTYQPSWNDLTRRHNIEQREFAQREQRIGGKIRNALDAVTYARQLNPDSSRGFMSNAYNYLVSSKSRAKALEQVQRVESRALSASQRAEIGAAVHALRSDGAALQTCAKASFLSERAALIERQSVDKQQLQSTWRRLGEDRSRAFEASRERHLSHGKSKDKKLAREDSAKSTKEFKGAAAPDQAKAEAQKQTRSAGRKRSRTRKRN